MIKSTKECSQERLRLVRRLVELRLKLSMVSEIKSSQNKHPISDTKVIFGHHLSPIWKPTYLENKLCDVCTKTIWLQIQQFYECAGKQNYTFTFLN